MDGYNEALTHIDDRLAQRNPEGYKRGWNNLLTLLKYDQDSNLWHWNDPNFLDFAKPPLKLDTSWIPPDTIPQCLINKCLGDYGLNNECEMVRPPHLLDRMRNNNRHMLRDFNTINSPYTLDDPPAGMDKA